MTIAAQDVHFLVSVLLGHRCVGDLDVERLPVALHVFKRLVTRRARVQPVWATFIYDSLDLKVTACVYKRDGIACKMRCELMTLPLLKQLSKTLTENRAKVETVSDKSTMQTFPMHCTYANLYACLICPVYFLSNALVQVHN